MKQKILKNRLHAFILLILIAVPLIMVSAPSKTYAEEKGLGLGVIIGEPTGLSLKYWLSATDAVDLAAAWSFRGSDSIQIHGDYILHLYDLIQVKKGKLPLYFGVGARLKHEETNKGDETELGVRLPVGLSYLWDEAPVEFFGEIAPIVDIAPNTETDINIGFGARYYF